MAKNNKTRFFYVLYSDKTWVFDQSERAYYPIYIINTYKTKTIGVGLHLRMLGCTGLQLLPTCINQNLLTSQM